MDELDNLLNDLKAFATTPLPPIPTDGSILMRPRGLPYSPALPSQLDSSRTTSATESTSAPSLNRPSTHQQPLPRSMRTNSEEPQNDTNLAGGSASFGSNQSLTLSGGGKIGNAPNVTPGPFVNQHDDTPLCGGCGLPIDGQHIEANGKHFHKDHFLCRCGRLLTFQKYIERDGAAWCKKCFGDEFAPKCAFCSDPIHERAINALGKSFHPEHFFCCQCGKNFGTQEKFLEHEGKAYCEEDYLNLFAVRCNRCGTGLIGDYIVALDAYWHQDCFTCADCGAHFKNGQYYQIDGVALCETHYYGRNSALCFTCKKPIMGRCVVALDQKYHPNRCFKCHFCQKLLTDDATATVSSYKAKNDKPYCSTCHTMLFG
ncbi:hypothetical protein SeMB42_g00589 [Synchytrium endobioticum]|uniref:LIM zinc-binding domain-containing protein n=1 Tax=Synchytrium endobioticum TaxID=286115 RepID=A0A507DDY0_9FUNG|nr:hypothetical protein SeLEV6574_g01254 [Synchytrium endobioticum]TPX53784.1 hypothetical protein SeMB42_g00589 [Synchytrium endobioticum]